jgi:large subunit ribosomal protein L23
MALFGTKKDKKVAPTKAVKAPKKEIKKVAAAPAVIGTASIKHDVIIKPRITEKSGLLSQGGVYTFEVTKHANKAMIASTITSMYKVVPTKVSIVNLPAKNVIVRGRRGVVSGVRKAMVTLKKGDKIDFV